MPAQKGSGLDQMEPVPPRAGEAGQQHEEDPVFPVEARRGRSRPPEYENLLAPQGVFGHQVRARPKRVEAGGARERRRRAGGPQELLEALANSVGMAPDDDGQGPDRTGQHGSPPASEIGSPRPLDFVRPTQSTVADLPQPEPYCRGWTRQVASTGWRRRRVATGGSNLIYCHCLEIV